MIAEKISIAVLISGNGSNLQTLIEASKLADFPATVKLVISNNGNAYGLTRAQQAGIVNIILDHKLFSSRQSYDSELDRILLEYNIELICMAGFMRVVTPWFTEKWQGKLLNIHPSLLPAFPGINAIAQALDYGVKITGCTVHYVTAEVDTGPIIAQLAVNIADDDDIETLTKKIHYQENQLYPLAVKRAISKLPSVQ